MKNQKILSFFLLAIFSAIFSLLISNTASAAVYDLKCKKLIDKVNKAGETAHKNTRNRARNFAPNSLLKPAYALRDGIRRKLQQFNGTPYPVIDRNNTPIAFAYAKAISGRMLPEHKKNIDIAKIDKDLELSLDRVEAYPAKIQELIDQTANLYMERKVLKKTIAKLASSEERAIEVNMPYFKDGELAKEYRTEYYGSAMQLKLEAKTKLSERITKTEKDFAILVRQHVADIDKLSVFVHEMRREQSNVHDMNFSDPQKAIMVRADALYAEGAVGGILKDDLNPPHEAWNAAMWKAFLHETTNLYRRRKMDFKDDPRVSSLWTFLKSLTKKEQRALGLKNFYENLGVLRRYKWARVIPLLFGGGAWGFYARDEHGNPYILGVLDEWWADLFKREECIQSVKESDYLKCMEEYLSMKYPGKYLREQFDGEALVYQGQIKDQDIQKEIEDIKSERRKFLQEKSYESVLELAIAAAALDPSDPNTDAFRRELVKNPDQGLARMIILSPHVGVGYLSTKYPFAYEIPEVRALARIAVENRDDPKLLKTTLSRIMDFAGGRELSVDLAKLLYDMEAVKENAKQETQIDKLLDELLKQDRGVDVDAGRR